MVININYNGKPDEYIIYGTLFSLCNRIQTLSDGEFGDITMKQHFLLICVSVFEDPPSLKEAADMMGCSYQNVKRMAVSLEKCGYLLIQNDKRDHRRQILILTGKVAELSRKLDHISDEFMKRLFRGISASDIRTTMKTLEMMNQNIREEN